jgi:hypothetical protein
MYTYAQALARIEAGLPVRLGNNTTADVRVLLDPGTTRWLVFGANGGSMDLGAWGSVPRILQCSELLSYVADGTLTAIPGVERIADGKLTHGGRAAYCEYVELELADISFHEGAGTDNDEIRTAAGDFLAAGFLQGDWIDVEVENTDTNEGQYEILAVTADTIEVANGSLTDEAAVVAGDVTLKLWIRSVALFGNGTCRGIHVRADSRIQVGIVDRPDNFGHVIGAAEDKYFPWAAVEELWVNFRDGEDGDIVSIMEDGQIIT